MTDKENSGILLYAQLTENNYIHTVFFELADKAHELAQKLDGVEVNAVMFENPENISGLKESFQNMGISKVFYFDDKRLNEYSTVNYSTLFINLVKEIKPEILLIGATNQGRDLAPRISSALGTGLTADCTGLDINDKGQLATTRPTFGGQLMATILSKKYPQMATVRPNVFKVHNVDYSAPAQLIKKEVSALDGIKDNIGVLEFKKSVENVLNDLDNAEIIVSGGMGLKDKKGFELLKQFAQKIGASVGASRPAVEAGLASKDIQIGQTGKTVHPKIYIACGISGAIQHTVGMENSDYIIAINNDPEAQIFDIADTGIVGDFFEIIPKYLSLN